LTELFREDFSVDLSKWVLVEGTYTLGSGQLRGSAFAVAMIVTKIGLDWANYEVQADIIASPAYSNHFIILRYTDPNNYYKVEFRPKTFANTIKSVVLVAVKAGVQTTLVTVNTDYALPQTVIIRIADSGAAVKFLVWVGANQVINHLEASRSHISGCAGFGKNEYNTTIADNVVINSVEAIPPPPEPPVPPMTPVYPRLHIIGKDFKDYKEKTVQLTGIGWATPFLDGDHIAPETYAGTLAAMTAIKATGANHVRLSINLPVKWANTVGYPNYRRNLDWCVQACTSLGLYIIFCFHHGSDKADAFMSALLEDTSFNLGWTVWANSRKEWLTLVSNIAYRYRNEPFVAGYQNWAEPAGLTLYPTYQELFDKWRQFNIDNITTIQLASPYSITVVMCPGYYAHTWVDYLYHQNPIQKYNVAYGYQHYLYDKSFNDWWKSYEAGNFVSAKQQLETYLYNLVFAINDIGRCTICSEFAFSRTSTRQPNEEVVAKDFYDILKKYGNSWSQFSWGNGASDWYVQLQGLSALAPNGVLMSLNFNSEIIVSPMPRKPPTWVLPVVAIASLLVVLGKRK